MNVLDYEIADLPIRICSEETLEDTELWRPFRAAPNQIPLHTYEVCWQQAFPPNIGAVLAETEEVCLTESELGICRWHRLAKAEDFHAITTECGERTTIQVLWKNAPWGRNALQLFKVLSLPHLLMQHGRILMHGVYLDIGGRAIIFSAAPETGKTTQAKLWEKHRGARIVNGDRVIVSVAEEGAYAHGVPTCGASQVCENRTLPLEAIVFLAQAGENRAHICNAKEALKRLSENTYTLPDRPEDALPKIDLFIELIKTVPMIALECLPELGAVVTLEKLIKHG